MKDYKIFTVFTVLATLTLCISGCNNDSVVEEIAPAELKKMTLEQQFIVTYPTQKELEKAAKGKVFENGAKGNVGFSFFLRLAVLSDKNDLKNGSVPQDMGSEQWRWYKSDTSTVERNKDYYIGVNLENPPVDPTGVSRLTGDLSVFDPNGMIVASRKEVDLWNNKPAIAKQHTRLATGVIALRLDKDSIAGNYIVKAKVVDAVQGVTINLVKIVTLK